MSSSDSVSQTKDNEVAKPKSLAKKTKGKGKKDQNEFGNKNPESRDSSTASSSSSSSTQFGQCFFCDAVALLICAQCKKPICRDHSNDTMAKDYWGAYLNIDLCVTCKHHKKLQFGQCFFCNAVAPLICVQCKKPICKDHSNDTMSKDYYLCVTCKHHKKLHPILYPGSGGGSASGALTAAEEEDRKSRELAKAILAAIETGSFEEQVQKLQALRKEAAKINPSFALTCSGDEEEEQSSQAEDHADEGIDKFSQQLRVYYACKAGGQYQCNTLIGCKEWRTVSDDFLTTTKRLYCRECNARYRTSFGVVCELFLGDDKVRYCKAEIPPQGIMDVQFKTMGGFTGPALTPQEIIDKNATVALLPYDRVLQQTFNKFHYKFVGEVSVDTLPTMEWFQLFNLINCKPVGAKKGKK
jgi:hypothetical protein